MFTVYILHYYIFISVLFLFLIFDPHRSAPGREISMILLCFDVLVFSQFRIRERRQRILQKICLQYVFCPTLFSSHFFLVTMSQSLDLFHVCKANKVSGLEK